MLRDLVLERVKTRNLSVREAAKEIGVSHVTLGRLLDGGNLDLDTVGLISKWLGMSMANALGVYESDPTLQDTVAALIATKPQLADLFKRAATDLQRGEITPEDMREIIDYATYRFLARRNVANTKGQDVPEGDR